MHTILIIEDEKILRETLADILEISGYIVIQARDGESGIEMFSKTVPDLVICDINMPKMDGFEVLQILEAVMPASKFPPFIFQSAKTEPENIRKGMNLGATDFITKPYSAPELLKVIGLRLLERKKLEEALVRDERIRIAKELQGGVQRLVTAASEGVTALAGRLDEMSRENQDLLNNSGQLLRQAISEIRSVSNDSKIDLIKIQALEKYLNLIFETTLFSKDVKLHLTIDLEGDLLPHQLQIEICLLVREMINNTLKHAKAQTVSLKILRIKKEIQLAFQDDGIGFDINQFTSGNGLQNIRKKLAELNGKFSIESEPNKGTKIQLTL
tara:strand:+ start:135 stop:1118 length:984 start_codon:yes stop_codon:yes gene_type:complete